MLIIQQSEEEGLKKRQGDRIMVAAQKESQAHLLGLTTSQFASPRQCPYTVPDAPQTSIPNPVHHYISQLLKFYICSIKNLHTIFLGHSIAKLKQISVQILSIRRTEITDFSSSKSESNLVLNKKKFSSEFLPNESVVIQMMFYWHINQNSFKRRGRDAHAIVFYSFTVTSVRDFDSKVYIKLHTERT